MTDANQFTIDTGREFQKLPLSLDKYSVQTISIVADVINNCNHACTYCHPMENGNWGGARRMTGMPRLAPPRRSYPLRPGQSESQLLCVNLASRPG